MPEPNTPPAWVEMIDRYQKITLSTRLGIPLIYGIDAVSEKFKGFEIGDGFSDEQWEYLINHRHFEIGLLTPEDRIELANINEKVINKLLAIESIKKRFPRLNHNEWQMILIEIISALLEARIEREGKPRLDYIEQAVEIVD